MNNNDDGHAMTNRQTWPGPMTPPPETSPPAAERGDTNPTPLFAGVVMPPLQTIPVTEDGPWRLFLPTGLPWQPPLRDQLEAMVELTAAAVREFAEDFGGGPVTFPSVTLVSSPAHSGDIPGVAVYMFSMIAKAVSGDPFEGVRSAAHHYLDTAWNAAVNLDIERALRDLRTAQVAIEDEIPTLTDDAADLVVVGAHVVSLLHNLVGAVDRH